MSYCIYLQVEATMVNLLCCFVLRLCSSIAVSTRPSASQYDLVAKHRYQLFGTSDACQRPPPELMDRFLDKDELDKD
eukprot:SAG22_NODE_9163_length_606_cov_1.120316_2_plen_77_part_00